MFKKILRKKRIILIIDFILLLVSIHCYKEIYEREKIKAVYTNEAIEFAEENRNPIFRVSKIVLYSSAHAIDNSEEGKLQNIDISQFTDIAVYIDNKGKSEKITAENTVNQMFIDNIKVNVNSEKGEHILNYKNPNEFGKYMDLQNYEGDGILFNVPLSNDEQIGAGYSDSVFYTDCSNPISLGFVNRNLLTNCAIGNVNGEIIFDGSILRNANVDLNSISGKISFSIHIKNNLDEDFICNLDIDNNFEDVENGIYSGYVMKIQNTDDEKYNFLKVSE